MSPTTASQATELWEYVPDPVIDLPSVLHFFQRLPVSAEIGYILGFNKAINVCF
jgi:hypothetical protein